MKNDDSKSQKCPCDSGKNYSLCCKSYIEKIMDAPTAEALMRSRYTAFALQNESYLYYSWHPDTCPKTIHLNKNTKWLGLNIIKTVAGNADDDEGQVEFVARNKINGKASRLHENSRFKRINNRWTYFDGKINKKQANSNA